MKFFGNKQPKLTSIEEVIQSGYATDQLLIQLKKVVEGKTEKSRIHGFLTVIKNPGRPDEQVLCRDKHNILVNSGRDAMHDALYIDTAASQVGFNFIALTENAAAPSDTDTILTAEITTGGLTRALATTRTHTVGTNVSSLVEVFTATAVHTNVQKSGTFDLVAVGIMAHENTFTPVTLAINDTLQVTWTLTLDD